MEGDVRHEAEWRGAAYLMGSRRTAFSAYTAVPHIAGSTISTKEPASDHQARTFISGGATSDGPVQEHWRTLVAKENSLAFYAAHHRQDRHVLQASLTSPMQSSFARLPKATSATDSYVDPPDLREQDLQ